MGLRLHDACVSRLSINPEKKKFEKEKKCAQILRVTCMSNEHSKRQTRSLKVNDAENNSSRSNITALIVR